jgi:hypothetical protein
MVPVIIEKGALVKNCGNRGEQNTVRKLCGGSFGHSLTCRRKNFTAAVLPFSG